MGVEWDRLRRMMADRPSSTGSNSYFRNLDLHVYSRANNSVVASSTSTAQKVEQVASSATPDIAVKVRWQRAASSSLSR